MRTQTLSLPARRPVTDHTTEGFAGLGPGVMASIAAGTVAGLMLGGALLTIGPMPADDGAALALVLLWGLLGMAAGMMAAGVKVLLRR